MKMITEVLKMKKAIRITAAVLLAVSVLLLCACSKSKSETDTQTETAVETTETTTRPELKVNLGVTKATEINEKMMQQSGISKWVDECRGIYVSRMTPDSVLDKTKFRPGDIIQAIDGKETNTLDDVYDALSVCNPGDTVTVSVFRLNLLNGENEYFDVEVVFPSDEEETETSGE